MEYPKQKNLDGIYFRVNRDGKWLNLCFSDLTADEMETVGAEQPAEWWKRLAIHLAGELRNVAEAGDIAYL